MFFSRKAFLDGISLGRRYLYEKKEFVYKEDFETRLKKWYYNLCGYNQYGLLYHDLLGTRNHLVNEAFRRMPEEMQMQAKYRAIRANQLYLTHNILPKEEWTSFDDNHFYLQPYLDEVIKETQEIKEWNAKY